MEALIAAGVKGRPAALATGYRESHAGLPEPDRHLPDLLAPDPPPWLWPHACHRYGHIWEFGSDRCATCTAPWSEFGPEGAIGVRTS